MVLPLVEYSVLAKNERVKIAILDTGFDAWHLDISETRMRHENGDKTDRIVGFKSWIPNQVADKDSVGHGTHITALLLRMTEDCDIYVAKIMEKGSLPSADHIAEVRLIRCLLVK